jgi:hypothetical protein
LDGSETADAGIVILAAFKATAGGLVNDLDLSTVDGIVSHFELINVKQARLVRKKFLKLLQRLHVERVISTHRVSHLWSLLDEVVPLLVVALGPSAKIVVDISM